MILRQLKDTPNVSLLQIQEEIKHLELENQDLLARESATNQRLKEIKDEANQEKLESAEKISDLQFEIDEKEREIDALRHKVLESESLLEVKDEQIEELEKTMKKLSDTNSEINYYAELIDAKIRLQHVESQLSSKDLQLNTLKSTLSTFTSSISTLKLINQSLESKISLHESDYSLLSLEVDCFTHSLSHLHSQISKLTCLLHQKTPHVALSPPLTSIPQPPPFFSCSLPASINRLTAKLHEFTPKDSAVLPFVYQEMWGIMAQADEEAHSARWRLHSIVIEDKIGYEWRRLRQISEVYLEMWFMKGSYYGKINRMLEARTRKMAKRLREVRREVVMMNNNRKRLILKLEQLENINQALKSSIEAITSKKDRLKLEEVEAIQQETMKEIRKLNEQAILSFNEKRKDFAWLDLGREIATLKVLLRESDQKLQSKTIENDKLKSNLSKLEYQIQDMAKTVEEQARLPKLDEVEDIKLPDLVKETSILNYLEPEESDEQEEMDNYRDIIAEKLENTYNL